METFTIVILLTLTVLAYSVDWIGLFNKLIKELIHQIRKGSDE